MIKDVPTIGGARGVFEIFVPGLFLFLNLVAAVYLFPWVSVEITKGLKGLAANTPMALVIIVCFSYLCGVVLRLGRADLADDASAYWIRRFNPRARRPVRASDSQQPTSAEGLGTAAAEQYWSWATDQIPFIRWIGEMCDLYMPQEVKQYYSDEWAPRLRDGQNKQFLNLCKVAISKDRSLSAEVYTAESLTRYAACMFYALLLAGTLAAGTSVFNLAHALNATSAVSTAVGAGIACFTYLVAAWRIVKSLRFVRLKEVETLFYACYIKNLRMSGSRQQSRSAAAN